MKTNKICAISLPPGSEQVFKGVSTFSNATRDDCFSYLRFAGGSDREIPGPEQYTPAVTRTATRYFVPQPGAREGKRRPKAYASHPDWHGPKAAPLYEPGAAEKGKHGLLLTTQAKDTRFRKPTLDTISGPGRDEVSGVVSRRGRTPRRVFVCARWF